MKQVDGIYVQEDMDPYSEYKHVTETTQPRQENTQVVVKSRGQKARRQADAFIEGVDEAIEGAEIMFEFGNKLMERLRRL